MRGGRATIAAVGLAALALVALAPSAGATFHLIQIREVYAGSGANPGSEYVELQMWAEDQQHVAGHLLRTYNATGAVTGTDAFPTDVPRGADQSTLVLATPEAEAEFGFLADAPLNPSGRLDPSGGAVCWELLDCVAWGNFSGSLPITAGTPAAAAGIPDGMALRRSIAADCATLLEPTDDHDNSAADFAPAFPSPRPNSVAPSERGCVAAPGALGPGGSGAGGQAAGGRGAPDTTLRGKPPKASHDATPSFRFGADEAGSRFECRIDARAFVGCRSPFTAKSLPPGHHTFRVRARDTSGRVDPSPASYRFRVLPKPRR